MPIGAIIPKKITANTTGLKTMPNNNPNLIHSLLIGRSSLLLAVPKVKNITASAKKYKLYLVMLH